MPKEPGLRTRYRERTTGFHIGGGAIFGNPKRGSPDDSGAADRTCPASRKGIEKDRVDRRRVFEGGMKVTRAVQTGFNQPRRAAGSVASEVSISMPRPWRQAGKANDPQRSQTLVQPRCDFGSSREITDGPEDPMNSREAAEALRSPGQPIRREHL